MWEFGASADFRQWLFTATHFFSSAARTRLAYQWVTMPEGFSWSELGVDSSRVQVVKDIPLPSGRREFVLYWCMVNHRAEQNHALDAAIALGNQLGLPVVVYQAIRPDYPYASDRIHAWALEGMMDMATDCASRGLPYWLELPRTTKEHRPRLAELGRRAAAVVSDLFPTFIIPGHLRGAAKALDVPLFAVDASCVVPMQRIATRQIGAYTLRPKLRKLWPEYLERTVPSRAVKAAAAGRLAEALPPYLGIVVGLSLILLLLVFRSVVVPLLATAGFLLSLAAAFGATVAVYQWGWLGTVFDVHTPGPIMSFLPILLTGILFGLAMDYQVFLVSGMRESYAHGQPARAAVRSGFAHAAPVVTAAALIMASVFAGFVFSHLTMIRAMSYTLAIGVLFDAFIVRMTLTPAVMHLLGRRAWYIPRWLDRILPDVDVEGSKIAALAAAGQHGPDAETGTQAPPARDTVDA